MQDMTMRSRTQGFTLIELSVVLVIIGLLTGGILLSQSLIRSSKVQTILSDVSTFQTAMVQFRQKYGAVAGDMSNATSYWGTNPNCAVNGGVGTGTQTCNGNGDGQITFQGSAPYEMFLVWQHLANAQMIAGQYTGASDSTPARTEYCAPGINCPPGQVNGAQSYYMSYFATSVFPSIPNYWTMPTGHYLIVGNAVTSGLGFPAYPFLTPSEAYSLDGKVDDSMPGQGRWRTVQTSGTYNSNCVVTQGTTSAPASDSIASEATSVYYTSYSAQACSFMINLTF